MRAASLKLKKYKDNLSIVENSYFRRRIFYLFISSFGTLALLYVVVLGNMTFNIIERKSLEAEARTLANEVLELELKYMDAASLIDKDLAMSLGFKETKTNFVTRKSIGSIKVANNDL